MIFPLTTSLSLSLALYLRPPRLHIARFFIITSPEIRETGFTLLFMALFPGSLPVPGKMHATSSYVNQSNIAEEGELVFDVKQN